MPHPAHLDPVAALCLGHPGDLPPGEGAFWLGVVSIRQPITVAKRSGLSEAVFR